MGDLSLLSNVKLKQEAYAVSLIQMGIDQGLLSADQVERINRGLMENFENSLNRYTGGESQTVRVEAAEMLIRSSLYVVDLYLKHLDAPGKALELFRNLEFGEVYRMAMAYGEQLVQETKAFYEQLEHKRLPLPNRIYTETFENAIPLFFKSYNLALEAQNTVSDIDYPLVVNDMTIEGIAYIRTYLETFKVENDFCCRVGKEMMVRLLEGYGKLNRIHYEESPLNVFEIALAQGVFIEMVRKKWPYEDDRRWILSKDAFKNLDRLLIHMPSEQLSQWVMDCVKSLMERLDVLDEKVKAYIYKTGEGLSSRVVSAVEHGHLDRLIITESLWDANEMIYFEDGIPMEDGDFKALYENIIRCETAEQKLEWVHSQIRSIKDFVDLLKLDCFDDEDYSVLFRSLGVFEAAYLLKMLMGGIDVGAVSELKAALNREFKDADGWKGAFCSWMVALDSQVIDGVYTQMQAIGMRDIV